MKSLIYVVCKAQVECDKCGNTIVGESMTKLGLGKQSTVKELSRQYQVTELEFYPMLTRTLSGGAPPAHPPRYSGKNKIRCLFLKLTF